MKAGSIVQTVGNFEQVRREWGLPYPKLGDALTVSAITSHPNKEVRAAGIVLLHFEEIPNLTGVCDKTIHGKINFIEIMLPDDIEEILSAPIEETNIKQTVV
jgi:hypothetical protein